MKVQYSLSGVLLALTAALILEGASNLPLIFAWLMGINLFAFVFYGIDKVNSRSSATQAVRIPEVTLLLLALAGGSPAAALAMVVFGHKIRKAAFVVPFLLIVGVQAALVYAFRHSIPRL